MTHEIKREGAEGYVGAGMPTNYVAELKYGPVIDLGLAENPMGSIVKPDLLNRYVTEQKIVEYDKDPHHKEVKETIISGIGLNRVTEKNVILNSNGSYGAGDEVVRALTRKFEEQGHQTILYAPTYSFPNVKQYTVRHGAHYQPLPKGETFSPGDSLKSVLKMNKSQLHSNIVYIDYPNNPTGVADGMLLREVVEHVSENGGVPFVDLAFGEVLGDEFKHAIQYTIDYKGVCVASLTKTQGLAALRAGYAIFNSELAESVYEKGKSAGGKLVFGLSPYSKAAIQILMKRDGNHRTLAENQGEMAAEYNTKANQALYETLKSQDLDVLPTLLETPVQVVFDPKGRDLYGRLSTAGIKTESLNDYRDTLQNGVSGLGDSAVRILTPRNGQLEDTLARIELAMSLPEDSIVRIDK